MIAVPECPACGSRMVLRANPFGEQFYGCSQYPSCYGARDTEGYSHRSVGPDAFERVPYESYKQKNLLERRGEAWFLDGQQITANHSNLMRDHTAELKTTLDKLALESVKQPQRAVSRMFRAAMRLPPPMIVPVPPPPPPLAPMPPPPPVKLASAKALFNANPRDDMSKLIRDFQLDVNLNPSGRMNELTRAALAVALGVDIDIVNTHLPSMPAPELNPPEAGAMLEVAVSDLQRALRALGFGFSSSSEQEMVADGVWGPITKSVTAAAALHFFPNTPLPDLINDPPTGAKTVRVAAAVWLKVLAMIQRQQAARVELARPAQEEASTRPHPPSTATPVAQTKIKIER